MEAPCAGHNLFLTPAPHDLYICRAAERASGLYLPRMNVATSLRTAAVSLVVGLAFAGSAAAQTGKLAGRVTDASGASLPGVTVVVVGTERGAATDLDGYYTIIAVPAGTQDVRFSYLGFASQTVAGVDVNINQTSTVDAQLSEEASDLGEVVVRADRPLVEADVSNSRVNIGAEELRAVPAATIETIVGLQAGIQGGFSVRGSGSDEISFQVNGLTLRDERNNAPYTNISLTSIQEIQVQTGGFNAEYGNVRSGVVNVITKEGSPTRYEADVITRFSPAAQKNFGPLANDLNSYWVRPWVDPEVAFTGTQNWDAVTRSQYPSFQGWIAESQKLLRDDNPGNDLTPEGLRDAFLYQHRKSFEITEPDYEVDLGFGGPVPGISRALGGLRFFGSFRREQDMLLIPLNTDRYTEQSAHLKLTSDLAPGLKLSVEGRLGEEDGTGASRSGQPGFFRSSTGIAANLTGVSFINSRLFTTDYWGPSSVRYSQVGAQLTHALSATSGYEVHFNRFNSNYETNPGRRRDPTTVVTIGGVGFDEGPFGYEPYPSDGVDGLRMGVGLSNSRDSSSVTTYTLRGDYTNQLNRFLEFKAGLEGNLSRSRINYAQVDSFLTGTNFRVLWDKSPTRGAAYAQTKLEFKGMIANTGLRLDYANAGGEFYDFELFDRRFAGVPITDGDPRPGLDSLFTGGATERIVTLSPRLGVSFPITALSKLYFNYGHFRQLPTSDDLYLVRAFTNSGQISRIANPNNPLPLTVAYEIGYEQSFLRQFVARVAGYYKDIELDPRLVTYQSRSGSVTYALTEPNAFADVRGFELTLSKTRGDWFRGFANYTYMVYTSGFFGFPTIFENATTQRDQADNDAIRRSAASRPVPRPYARIGASFFAPDDLGPRVLGLRPLGGWEANFIGRWQDGGQLSYGDNGVPPPGVVNNVDIRDSWTVDLRLQKPFTVGGRSATFFADVFNLTNRKTLTLFSGAVDAADRNAYLTSLHFPASADYSNVPGTDVVGAFRPDGVAFQPLRSIGSRNEFTATRRPDGATIYYERESEQYLVFQDGAFIAADGARVQEVLDTKAYIDMPNQSFLNFLGPRDVFVGIRVSL